METWTRTRLLTIAVACAAVLAASIVTGIIMGELPEALWFLLVPIGTFGAAVVGGTCVALALTRPNETS